MSTVERGAAGVTIDCVELYYAEMEAARNASESAYFSAHPKLDAEAARSAFRAGFERAFARLWRGEPLPVLRRSEQGVPIVRGEPRPDLLEVRNAD